MNEKTKRMPDFIANGISEDGKEESSGRWRNIGVGFVNKKSLKTNEHSITILLDAVPLSGKIILTKYIPKEE